MKNKKGFTLIELLLVLAIIGIISAIAIPALLGQRARARDKSARSNVASIMSDLVGSYDKLKEAGTATSTGTAIVGTSAAPLVPAFFTATNPWSTSGALLGYNQTFVTEVATAAGVATAASAVAGTLGQVQLGYVAPTAGVSGLFAGAVYTNAAVNGSNVFSQTAGVD